MAEPHWTAYVAMAAGILGAITGISGAVMGYISYRRSNAIKALDLRLELRRTVNDIESCVSALPGLLDHANQSRQSVAAATGKFHSGAMEIWKQAFDQDMDTFKVLAEQAPSPDGRYDTSTPTELESQLVAAHKLRGKLNELHDKYTAALRADDEERQALRDDMRSRVHGVISSQKGQ
jgi:hypothetical protein